MKKYIFITPEGSTSSPNGNDVENMQVIGIVENVVGENEALKKLLADQTASMNAQIEEMKKLMSEMLAQKAEQK